MKLGVTLLLTASVGLLALPREAESFRILQPSAVSLRPTQAAIVVLHAVDSTKDPLSIYTGSRVESVPINLLSFDGGGVKGVMSVRMLACSLQQLMMEPNTNVFTKNLANYIECFKDVFPVMWMVWAQQMDAMDVAPQVHLLDGSEQRKWMDFSLEDAEDRKMIESILKVDLAYEYYLAHILAISGTSTGGLITLATMLRMSLTQIAALYMDPGISSTIFPSKTKNIFRWFGILQAKYTQEGVYTIIDRITTHVAPFEKEQDVSRLISKLKFINVSDDFNARLKARILGAGFTANEKNRLLDTLRQAQEGSIEGDSRAERELAEYEETVKKASKFLLAAKMKRFKVLDNKPNLNSLEELLKMEDPSYRYDEAFHSTRFFITSRCVNNGKAVIFDSLEPILSKDEDMLARNALQFGDAKLDVRKLTIADVGQATSAAPYFFPAYERETEKGSFFFHDGGVMANDPGLISLCISYRHFTESVVSGPKSVFPLFKLLRIGCGKEAEYLKPPFTASSPQGAPIVTKLADIFMSSDAERTDLLADVLVKTSVLEGTKLDATVPTGDPEDPSLPMDQLSTAILINKLFGKIDNQLEHMVVIPEDILKERLADRKVGELTDSIGNATEFLVNCDDLRITIVNSLEDALKLARGADKEEGGLSAS